MLNFFKVRFTKVGDNGSTLVLNMHSTLYA